MFWTGNTSSLLVSDTPHHRQEGSEKCPVSMGSNANPEGVSDGELVTDGTPTGQEDTPSHDATVAKDPPTSGKGSRADPAPDDRA